jgi:hypothetical protein
MSLSPRLVIVTADAAEVIRRAAIVLIARALLRKAIWLSNRSSDRGRIKLLLLLRGLLCRSLLSGLLCSFSHFRSSFRFDLKQTLERLLTRLESRPLDIEQFKVFSQTKFAVC